MISSSNIALYVCLLLTVVGLIFITIAYRSWNSTNKIIKNGLKTEGVVINILERRDRRRGATGTKAPAVQYKTQKGDVITYYSDVYTSPSPYYAGQIVPIWYMPDNPQEATLKGADAYLLPSVFAGFGVLAMLFGLPSVIKFFISLM